MEDGALALCVFRAGPVACRSTHYDVFLSFPGGSDTARDSLPGRLHAGLAAAGVSLWEPDKSQASLLPDAAVRQSKICIPILSQDYLSSDRCLRGLVQMMEGKRSARQMVLPIFDRVEPSRVRYLTRSFEMVRHSDIEGVQTALFEVSMLHGWKVTDGREEELVKTVVQTVQRCLRPDLQKVPQIARYNVFLNFRGADTRHGIAYDLYNGLVNAGVSVFKDDTDLPIGEEFGSQLLSAISRSTIYITVLSQGYASSKWCLREVTKMMECTKTNGHLVMPIFYGVEFSDVRSGRAFHFHAIHECEKDIAEAKRALRHLGYFGGFHDRDGRYKLTSTHASFTISVFLVLFDRIDDGKLTRDVVQQTLRKLRHRFQLDVPEHLLSIDDRVKSR
ncbi:uncharacterized protein LOC115666577 [Syzygium oleosum]|uniref:uncharacterized protein LOC115666577 n=1 Tax=Syzygium oleosum TaxID=219896 RepID=UPI0024BB180F|nr:uncharacterized protein LOC115666577 [Syzygium oleosum]